MCVAWAASEMLTVPSCEVAQELQKTDDWQEEHHADLIGSLVQLSAFKTKELLGRSG